MPISPWALNYNQFGGMMKLFLLPLLLLFFGCQPSNLLDCKMEASKRPTTNGVLIAYSVCEEQFKEPRDLFKESSKLLSDDEAFGKRQKQN